MPNNSVWGSIAWGGIPWDTILKVVGGVAAGVGWIYQARATVLRGKIKTDLEILEKARGIFGTDDERTRRVEVKASQLMNYLYGNGSKYRRYRLPDLSLGVLGLLGAGAFAWSGLTPPFTWWELVLSGILGFVAFGAFLNAFDLRRPSPGA